MLQSEDVGEPLAKAVMSHYRRMAGRLSNLCDESRLVATILDPLASGCDVRLELWVCGDTGDGDELLEKSEVVLEVMVQLL